MIKTEDLVIVGKFQKTHALKGELNVILDIDPQYFLEGNPLIVEIEGINVPFYVDSVRKKGSTSYLVKIEGIENGEEAAEFVNKEISIRSEDAEEWLTEDILEENFLTGFTVVDDNTGKHVGKITGIEDSTANVLFIVEDEKGETIFIPANEDLITETDEGAKIIRMNLPEGLLNIESLEDEKD